MARRLAGARGVKVGALLDRESAADMTARAIRVEGRIRCPDPIVTPQADRLVAFHRDVEVRLADGAWRNIERLRETRSFDLWDHDGWLAIDPALAAEPLVVLPHIWEGAADELDEGYRPALERLRAEGRQIVAARAVTRMVSAVDRLQVLVRLRRDAAGELRLVPPAGGFVITNLELDEAMRLLGGPHRGRLLAGMGTTALGLLAVLAGLLMLALRLITGA